MRNNLIALTTVITLGLAGPVLAQESSPALEEASQPAQGPIREGDMSLTCAQVGDAAAALSETMGGEAGDSIFSRLGGVARAGAAMLIPGAGLAIAGADALTQPERDRREAEALAVQNRWYYLNGLYAGRRCHEAAEAAADAAAGQPQAPASPTGVVAPTGG